MKSAALQHQIQLAMMELEDCGFQPVGNLVTQGSGTKGRALSADGTTWAELGASHPGFRENLRQLLKTGVLRGAGLTAQFTTEFNDGRRLVTTTAGEDVPAGPNAERLAAGTSLADLAHRHMQRIECYLHDHHPVKPLIHAGMEDLPVPASGAAAASPPRAVPPLTTLEQLQSLGIAPHLARLIAGPCSKPAEVLAP